MHQPREREFKAWRNSEVGIWFFEHVLQSYADVLARANGTAIGQQEIETCIRYAGTVEGVEYAISLDPYEGDQEDEVESSGEGTPRPAGL